MNTSKETGVIFTDTKSPELLMHEAGHRANRQSIHKRFGDIGLKAWRKAYTVGANVGGVSGLLFGMHGDKDSTLGQTAWMHPLIGAAPQLAEEGMASARGLNAMRKAQGWTKALKGMPKLLAALGTYAAMPTAMSTSAYLMNRWRPSPNQNVPPAK